MSREGKFGRGEGVKVRVKAARAYFDLHRRAATGDVAADELLCDIDRHLGESGARLCRSVIGGQLLLPAEGHGRRYCQRRLQECFDHVAKILAHAGLV
jgi:hypothetical protein